MLGVVLACLSVRVQVRGQLSPSSVWALGIELTSAGWVAIAFTHGSILAAQELNSCMAYSKLVFSDTGKEFGEDWLSALGTLFLLLQSVCPLPVRGAQPRAGEPALPYGVCCGLRGLRTAV